ncbi:MAG TPA: hypothetical protein ENI99_02505 [Sedimenticola sp.]|nr:hypothetical protein [Sedimenticola sp.]
MQISYRIWMTATTVVLIAVIAIAGLQIWRQTPGDIAMIAPLDASCDLQKEPCEAVFPDGGRLVFSISPRPIEGLRTLQLQVQAQGLDVRSVEVDFRGVGMNMGFNRPRLERQSAGRYAGSGVLSVCIMERMTWEATVLAGTDKGILAAPFRFETLR